MTPFYKELHQLVQDKERRNKKDRNIHNMRTVKVSAIQLQCEFSDNFDPKRNPNIVRAELLVREAARKGAQIILLPEFFSTLYFCQEMKEYCDAEGA